MRKAVKWSLISFGALLGLFVLALLNLAKLIDPNDYKDRIAQAVLDKTGRHLTFEGDLSLLAFPRFGVDIGGVSLGNHPGFGPQPMIRVKSAKVSVRLLPLLMGKVKFQNLRLDGLDLYLGRTADGVSNWDDLVGRTKSSPEEQPSDESFSLDVAGVSVSDARIEWDDQKVGKRFVLSNVTVSTGAISRGAVFPVEARLDYQCSTPDIRGTIELIGGSSIDMVRREYAHLDMRVAVSAQGKDVPGEMMDGLLKLKFLAMDFRNERAQVSGLEMSAYGTTVQVDGTFQGITNGLEQASVSLNVIPFDARNTLVALGQSVPATADPKAMTKIGGRAEIDFKPGKLSVSTMEVEMDGTRIAGNGFVEKREGWPFCFARMDVGDLNLDHYLPAGGQEEQAEASADEQAPVLPVELLRKLNMDMEARIAQLVIGRARLDKVVVAIKGEEGQVKMAPLSAEAYGGTVSLEAQADVRGKQPTSSIALHAKGVDGGALARDMAANDTFRGVIDCSLDVKSAGVQRQTILRNMNGTYSVQVTDGVFPGVNLLKMTRETHERKNRKGTVEATDADMTRFGSIKASGAIKDGVVWNDDLEFKAPGLRAGGQGAVDLASRRVDYMLKAKLVADSSGQTGAASDDLFGVTVPIHVSGTLDDPRYWVSVSEYVKMLGGAVVGTAGTIFGGVKSVLKGVGSALDDTCCGDSEKEKSEGKRSKFLGIF